MTRLPAAYRHPSTPASVALGELALAAGVAGQSVTLCFHDFPAPLLCVLWKYYVRSMGANEVHHIRSQADIKKLSERVGNLRLVLVHVPRFHNSAAWAVQMAMSAGATGTSRPAMFSRFLPDDLDEDPGATLVLRHNSQEHEAIMQWLMAEEHAAPDLADIDASTSFVPDPAIGSILSPGRNASERGLQRLRDRQILHGLMIGACVLRTARQGSPANGALTITLDDYQSVRGLLQTQIVCSADEPFDPLAVEMVNRANVYLSVRYGPDGSEQNPFYADDHEYHAQRAGDRPGQGLITRREVADLGNIGSRMVRELVEYLQRQTDGCERFNRMGLVHRLPGQDAWQNTAADRLVAYLRPWSLKQVRTHFDRLRQTGLITAERDPVNGPWRYELPEELATINSAFATLPGPEELATGETER